MDTPENKKIQRLPFKPWSMPDFNQDKDVIGNKPKKQKTRNRTVTTKYAGGATWQQKKDMLWVETFTPRTESELAVHSRKISEVKEWFKWCLQQGRLCTKAPMLILNGPAGAGKTATVKAICKDMTIQVFEWSSQVQGPYLRETIEGLPERLHTPYLSQENMFSNFILRVSKYSLHSPTTSLQRLILIEEFPHGFVRNPQVFHALLCKFSKAARCLFAFIITDVRKGDTIEHSLFPLELQRELNMHTISFNPVTPTLLTKMLNKINNSMQGVEHHRKLSDKDIKHIANEAMGDIRNAINQIAFFSMSIEQPKESQTAQKSISSRDESLSMFHALGKVLYCKREPVPHLENVLLPTHLKNFERDPLACCPEEVFEKTSMSENDFSLFLHQNYLAFIEDMEIGSYCSEWFSTTDVLSGEWSDRSNMQEIKSSIVTRGLMFNLKPSKSGNRFRPLQKPQFYESTKKYNALKKEVQAAFKDKCFTSEVLQTELIPFYSKLPSSLTAGQTHLVNKLSRMSLKLKTHFSNLVTLTEKDGLQPDLNESACQIVAENICVSTNQFQKEESDDEVNIEEYNF